MQRSRPNIAFKSSAQLTVFALGESIENHQTMSKRLYQERKPVQNRPPDAKPASNQARRHERVLLAYSYRTFDPRKKRTRVARSALTARPLRYICLPPHPVLTSRESASYTLTTPLLLPTAVSILCEDEDDDPVVAMLLVLVPP